MRNFWKTSSGKATIVTAGTTLFIALIGWIFFSSKTSSGPNYGIQQTGAHSVAVQDSPGAKVNTAKAELLEQKLLNENEIESIPPFLRFFQSLKIQEKNGLQLIVGDKNNLPLNDVVGSIKFSQRVAGVKIGIVGGNVVQGSDFRGQLSSDHMVYYFSVDKIYSGNSLQITVFPFVEFTENNISLTSQ